MKASKEVSVWACGYCGKFYYNKEQADFCHADRTCSKCGATIGKTDYYTACKSCRDKTRHEQLQGTINKAIKMTYAEYMAKCPEYPVIYGDEFFFDDYDCLLDRIREGDNKTPIIWGSKKVNVTLDAYDIVERYEEQVEIEDFSLDKQKIDEIKEFCSKWNEKHAQDVYYEDNSIFIVLEVSKWKIIIN